MAFKIDFRERAVVVWHRSDSGLTVERDQSYTPRFYLAGPSSARATIRSWLKTEPTVVEVTEVHKRTRLREDEAEPVLAVDLSHTASPPALATRLRRDVVADRWAPGTVRFFNVDFAPQFRYCLETGTDPTPEGSLSTLSLSLPEPALAERSINDLKLDGERAGDHEEAIIETVSETLVDHDPDVLIVNDARIVPLLAERALATEHSLQLGRLQGWSKLAGENTFESYGKVGHSAARYNVPGRILIDTSNSFLWAESSLAGLLYLVEASHKPLQETAWGSIGNILTSIQIREATDRGVLVPWNKWEPEHFTDVQTMHAADRGGFIMDPQVGFHETVHELDFASLYPAIMCEYNISPDTILCSCHDDRTDIPELDYHVCDRRGFIADVLEPLLTDRAAAKERIAEAETAGTAETDVIKDQRAIAGAIKWVLVSCFGYQGYRNSKFGRIECHEAINAVAREIFLTAKERLEAGGWQVIHGIVDSLWVTAAAPDPEPLAAIADEIADRVRVPLDHEDAYDWAMFVPRRGTDRGALTRYVAKRSDGSYKLRGIEARQRSTPPYVASIQRELLDALDEYRSPEPVIDRLDRAVTELHAGTVDPADLVITKRASKPVDAYTQETLTVGALRRAERNGLSREPGQSVQFVVVANDADRVSDRVRLAIEDPLAYDAAYYEEQLLRAAESVVAPLGWERSRIVTYRERTTDANLLAFKRAK